MMIPTSTTRRPAFTDDQRATIWAAAMAAGVGALVAGAMSIAAEELRSWREARKEARKEEVA